MTAPRSADTPNQQSAPQRQSAPQPHSAPKRLITAARRLNRDVASIDFDPPVTHVYNPLRYAWDAHRQYLRSAPADGTDVLFLGMNPGPWGMAQTGVPFGEVTAVRDWIGITGKIGKPEHEHPKRPIEGLRCRRSEVSGRRLWGLFRDRYQSPDAFFSKNFVANYCPLVFMETSGKNRTPDKLPRDEREPLDAACDRHLLAVLKALNPTFAVGVGAYAEACLRRVTKASDISIPISRVLHPSPASPAANRDWAGQATRQLAKAGVWG